MSAPRLDPRPDAGPVAPPRPDFDQVYAAHAAFVWRVLRRLGVREADVPDACQEVFLVVLRRLPEFDGASAVQSWLFAICLRVAAGQRRRAYVRRESVTDAPPEAAVQPEQAEQVALHQARALLDDALEALDEEKRAVFVLYELEQMPMEQVAATVGCPVKTAYSRLYAARERVTAHLRRAPGSELP